MWVVSAATDLAMTQCFITSAYDLTTQKQTPTFSCSFQKTKQNKKTQKKLKVKNINFFLDYTEHVNVQFSCTTFSSWLTSRCVISPFSSCKVRAAAQVWRPDSLLYRRTAAKRSPSTVVWTNESGSLTNTASMTSQILLKKGIQVQCIQRWKKPTKTTITKQQQKLFFEDFTRILSFPLFCALQVKFRKNH